MLNTLNTGVNRMNSRGPVASSLRTLVQSTSIAAPLVFSRTQADGAKATYLASDGTTFVEAAADTPRYNSTTQRLMLEGARTNIISNPRNVGSTGWTTSSVSVAYVTGPDGVVGSAARITEALATANHNVQVATGVVPTGVGDGVAVVVYFRPDTCTTAQIYSNAAAFSTVGFANFDLTGAGAVGTIGAGTSRATIQKIGDWYRCEAVFTATASSGITVTICTTTASTAARAQSYLGTGRTLDVFWPSIERNAFGASTILPAVGTPAQSVRGHDSLSATLASLNISGPMTVLASAVINVNAPSASSQMIIQVDDGSEANYFALRNAAGGATIIGSRNTASSGAQGSSTGSMTAGTLFRVGLSIDGTSMTYYITGGTAQTVAGGPSSGLTTLRFGDSSDGTRGMYGELASAKYLNHAVDGVALAALVDAL